MKKYISKFIKKIHLLLSVKRFYFLSKKLQIVSWIVFLVSMVYGMYNALLIVPEDKLQGDLFRIIYLHAPLAALSLGMYAAIVVLSAIYLIWKIRLSSIIVLSIAPVGLLYTLLTLITGSIWGKAAWGTYWVWDARLTSELVLLFLYVGYIFLYKNISNEEVAIKSVSILAIIGFIDLPIIHFSVDWWHTLHQNASMFKFGRSSIEDIMLYPIYAMFVAFASFAISNTLYRANMRIISTARNANWVKEEVYV